MNTIESNQPKKECVQVFGSQADNVNFFVKPSHNEIHPPRFLTEEELDEIFSSFDSPYTINKPYSPDNNINNSQIRQPVIYVLTVSTLYNLYDTDSWEYNRERTQIECDQDNRSSLFLSFDAAEKIKEEYVKKHKNEHRHRLFSIVIDEYEEGADTTISHPRRAWYYDNNGNLVKELVRVGATMIFTSKKGLPNVGDVVELPISPTSIGLGIIASVPIHRNDFIENISLDSKSSIREVPYDPRCYHILTTCEDFHFIEYEATDFMPYSGNHGNADFMREYLRLYKIYLLS